MVQRITLIWVVNFFLQYSVCQKFSGLVPMCPSEIYCQGPILEAVNYFQLFNDSKDYVDMPLIKTPGQTLTDFKQMFPQRNALNYNAVSNFVSAHFLPPGHELVPNTPSDWTKDLAVFEMIKDTSYRKWASDLNDIWLQLSKKIDTDVLLNPDKYSLLYVPYPFVVPGGRFREYYYWDAYWIMKGMLISQMYNSTKYMIKNYVGLVNQYGFMPNGGRVYYMKRSQPPMLIPMVHLYYQETGDKDFVSEVLPTLEKEFQFWQNNRSATVSVGPKSYTLYQYNTPSNVPRPESFSQDVESSKNISNADKPTFYSNVASTAESGWDFGSRWFADRMTMQTIKTKRILPVDLNAFICRNMNLLSQLFSLTGDYQKSTIYGNMYKNFVSDFTDVFYDHSSGVWFDYDMDTNAHNNNFYPSSVVPLYTGCFKFMDNKSMEKTLKYLKDTGALSYLAGVPTSFINTTQQWDFPNGWPPLNHMIIEGLRTSGSPLLEDAAFTLANKWVGNNYLIYQQTSRMFEKYDVTKRGTAGSGGEYSVQIGFGWTNGVALDLLRTYGQRLVAPVVSNKSNHCKFSSINYLLLTLLILFIIRSSF